MAIVPLPLSPGAEARALLHHLLGHGDVVGRDTVGRTVIQLAVDDWVLDRLLAFDAGAAELEDVGDDEPDADNEEDGPPVPVEIVRPKAGIIYLTKHEPSGMLGAQETERHDHRHHRSDLHRRKRGSRAS